MALRLKTHWFQEGRRRGPAEQASVMAAAIWKTATQGLDGLRQANYSVDVGAPYIAVLTEFLVFLVTVADRVAYRQADIAANSPVGSGARGATDNLPGQDAAPVVDASWRGAFTVALAKRIADVYQENLERLLGPLTPQQVSGSGPAGAPAVVPPRDHAQAFIALLNERMAEYGDFEFGEFGPDFAFLRYFGSCIESVLPDVDDRRWALDQVMAVQAPEAIEVVMRGMRGVMGIGGTPRRARKPGSAASD